MNTHLENVAEQSDMHPLFIVQGKCRYLVLLASAHFFHPKPKYELVHCLV